MTRQLRVLLVEDDEDHVFLIRRALRDVAGVEVTVDVTSDGEEAMRYLELRRSPDSPTRPDVAVVDLKVPKVDGFDVLRWIRHQEVFGRLPVVVLTSSEHPEDRERAAGLGAQEYLCKPLDGSQFRSQLQTAAVRWAQRTPAR
jgi:two-component system response regulator